MGGRDLRRDGGYPLTRPLVDALQAESNLVNTQDLAKGALCQTVVIDLR